MAMFTLIFIYIHKCCCFDLQVLEASRLPGADQESASASLNTLNEKESEDEVVSDDKKTSSALFLMENGITKPDFPDLQDDSQNAERKRRSVEENSEDNSYTHMSTEMVCTPLRC